MMRKWLVFIFYCIAAVIILKVIVPSGFVIDKRIDLIDLMNGHAMTPFQYRTLTPQMSKLIIDTIPTGLHAKLQHYLENSDRFVKEWKRHQLSQDLLIPYLVTWMICLGCLLGSFYTWGSLIKYYLKASQMMADFSPLLAVFLLPLFFRYPCYPYDPMTLFICSLMFLLISKEQWGAFALAFSVSLFCRETTALFLGLALVRPSARSWKFYSYLMGLLIAWIAVRVGMAMHYADNSKIPLDTPLMNIKFLIDHPQAIIYDLSMFALIGYMAFKDWANKEAFLKRSFLIVFVPLTLLMLTIGRVDEFRVLLEGFAIFLILTLKTIFKTYYRAEINLTQSRQDPKKIC